VSLSEKARNALLAKIKKVEVEKNLNESGARIQSNNANFNPTGGMNKILEEEGDETDGA